VSFLPHFSTLLLPSIMVVKMSEKSTTVTLDPAPTSASVVTIALHPQPNRDLACDNSSTITSTTGETVLSNMSPSSCDSDSLQTSQMMVKKSLKLDLTHNNNEIKSIDTGSPPENEDDLSFKSPSSPRTCKKPSRWACLYVEISISGKV
jgi:hypothetical protein